MRLQAGDARVAVKRRAVKPASKLKILPVESKHAHVWDDMNSTDKRQQ
jgi:hypothetical protein